MKIKTIQKNNKLNVVRTQGVQGLGNAFHVYEISKIDNTPTNDDNEPITLIKFQNGGRFCEGSIDGVIDTDLLEICRHRLKCFQNGMYSTRENAIALTHIEEALMWLNRRVEDRLDRDVLGTNNK